MKRSMLIFTLAMVVLLAFTACGGNGDAPDEVPPIEDAGDIAPISYEFDDLGFSFELPASWRGKYSLTRFQNEWARGVQVYHAAAQAEFGAGEGFLFNIAKIAAADASGPIGEIVAQQGGYVYVLNHAQESPWSIADPENELALEFMEMFDDISGFVQQSFSLIQTISVNGGNDETVTVLFYYHDPQIDPHMYLPPEAFAARAVDIYTENLYENFMWQMYVHTGIRMLGMWQTDGVHYVDLHEDAIAFFDGHGTTGGLRNMMIFEKSLASFPGMSAFEVRINGQYGVVGNHFNFNHIATVENGQVVARTFYSAASENWIGQQEEVASNPFAPLLQDFFAGIPGGWDVYSSPTHSPKAFYAHITGNPGTGIVAVRYFNPFGTPFAAARAFYLADGQVITAELDNIEGAPFTIAFTPAGRLVQTTAGGGNHGGNYSYTLFDVDFDVPLGGTPIIAYEFTIHAEMTGDGTFAYYRFDGGWSEGFANDAFFPITGEEFNAIRTMHGLDNLTDWRDMPDQTEMILNSH